MRAGLNNMPPAQTSAESFSALQQQVFGLEKGYQELKGEVHSGFGAIHAKLDERNRTPWIVIFSGFTLLLSIMSIVGYLAYTPIRDVQIEMRAQAIRDSQQSYDRDVRLAERLRVMQSKQDYLEGALSPLLKR
jgi:hypothetical protein